MRWTWQRWTRPAQAKAKEETADPELDELEKAFDASSQQQAKEERLPLVGRTREG